MTVHEADLLSRIEAQNIIAPLCYKSHESAEPGERDSQEANIAVYVPRIFSKLEELSHISEMIDSSRRNIQPDSLGS